MSLLHAVTRSRRYCATPVLIAAAWLLAQPTYAQGLAKPSVTSDEIPQTAASASHEQTAVASVPAQETSAESPAAALFGHMQIQGYADVGYGNPLQEKLPAGGLQGSTASFQIADLDLFFSSKLSEHWSFLSELLITSDFTNEFNAELDRLLVQYNPNKYLRAGFGKFNSGIGFYPDEFHRAKFFQTATGRPMMFSDEDNGGILPLHQVGLTVQGEIPSGAIGLHYLAEVSNGRSFRQGSAEIQNWVDSNNIKAVNGGLFATPDAVPGLRLGFSLYRDTLDPDAGNVQETITAAHAVYLKSPVEFINEMAVLKHRTEATGLTATSKTFYTQLAYRLGVTHPYFRYDYQDVPLTDHVFTLGDVTPPLGLRRATSAGLRVDVNSLIVFKVQYDHALQNGAWANGAHAQLAVAF
jgi:hypothetical protein